MTARLRSTGHTERSPLLGSTASNGRSVIDDNPRPILAPPILPYLTEFQALGLPPDNHWCPESLPTEGDKTAFTLLVLLYHKKFLKTRFQSVDDTWERWSTETKDASAILVVESRIKELWDNFFESPRTSSEVEQVLWTQFPHTEDRHSSVIRAIDLYVYLPEEVLSHRVLELSLKRAWNHNMNPPTSGWSTVTGILRAVYAPRVIHTIDLLGAVSYLGVLVFYSLRPPRVAIEETAVSEFVQAGLIVSYCIARMLQDFSWTKLPFLLTGVAFLSDLPAPCTGHLGYSVVLVALCMHVILLHIPTSPSPLYLLPFEQALPLATLVWNGLTRIFFPVLLLFFPALLIAALLLSFSLADIGMFSAPTILASPLEARTVFLMLIVIILLLLVCSLGVLVLASPFTSSCSSESTWDRYSTRLGLDARRAFVRTVLTYSSIPTHFSLQHSLRVQPTLYTRAWSVVTVIQRTLWWITAVPLALTLFCFLCWNLSCCTY